MAKGHHGGPALYTVGHSDHDWDGFIALLRQAGVTAVADVRSQPYSRRQPHFNREALQRGLAAHSIAYLFLGDELGGRPMDPALYDGGGRVDYDRVRRTVAFQRGLERLLQLIDGDRITLLCSEDDPRDCHRGLLITPALRDRGVSPLHLRRDGTVETTDELERDLLRAAGLGDVYEGLLAGLISDEERRQDLAEAYRRMAARKAYRLPPDGDGE
jgi:uncharacterized protein (DUF488 family)